MITCHIRYEIEPTQLDAFERFAASWMALVAQHGGTHHGYFLPLDAANDIAHALFSFPNLADYERYRERSGVDPEFVAADQIRELSGCVRRYDRNFLRPLLPGAVGDGLDGKRAFTEEELGSWEVLGLDP